MARWQEFNARFKAKHKSDLDPTTHDTKSLNLELVKRVMQENFVLMNDDGSVVDDLEKIKDY